MQYVLPNNIIDPSSVDDGASYLPQTHVSLNALNQFPPHTTRAARMTTAEANNPAQFAFDVALSRCCFAHLPPTTTSATALKSVAKFRNKCCFPF